MCEVEWRIYERMCICCIFVTQVSGKKYFKNIFIYFRDLLSFFINHIFKKIYNMYLTYYVHVNFN